MVIFFAVRYTLEGRPPLCWTPRCQPSHPVLGGEDSPGQSWAWDIMASVGGQASAIPEQVSGEGCAQRGRTTCAVSWEKRELGDVSAVWPREKLGSDRPCPPPRGLRPDLLEYPKSLGEALKGLCLQNTSATSG